MKKTLCFAMLFALFIANFCFAQTTEIANINLKPPISERTLCVATSINDSSKIIKNPGNCPVEILRRLGRALTKVWPENKSNLKYGTILVKEFAGTPNYICSISENQLSKTQLKECDELLNTHSKAFDKLMSEFNPDSEAINLKVAINISELQESYKRLISSTSSSPSNIPLAELTNIKQTVIPLLETLSDCYGIISVSEKGIFARCNAESNSSFVKFLSQKPITISKYLDDEPLIVFAQIHDKEEPSVIMKKLEGLPNMSLLKQIVASSGLDLEKDIFENYADESVIYANLTPTGENQIPDVRWVVYLKSMEKVLPLLPKISLFGKQLGVMVNPEKCAIPDMNIVKLTHIFSNGYGIYAAIIDKFLVLASTYEGINKALEHLKSCNQKENTLDAKDSNFFVRIKTSDLNLQLQQLLQSPLLRNQGIPPISNLTFFKDMNNISARIKTSENKMEIILDIPFLSKKDKK